MTATLCGLLIDSTKRFPDREAIIQGESSVSYQRLSRWAASIAAYLRREGLKQGDRVGILVQNSAEYVAIYYGILSAGGVVVSLNTATRARDLSNWLKHSDVGWLFAEASHPEFEAILQNLSTNTGIVEVQDSGINTATSQYLNLSEILADDQGFLNNTDMIAGDDLAAIMYTSGTTGHPKGVMLSHRNIYSNICSILDYLQLDHTDRVMNVLPFYYSYGNSVLHTHLAAGASTILENSMLYPRRVMERLVELEATGFSGVPSTYSLLLNRIRLDDFDLSSLRYLTQAGGAMPADSIRRLRKLVPNAIFFVMYGQTEASARLSYLPPEKFEEKAGSVGIPITGVKLEIRNEHGRLMPTGETGEIWAAGDNIMQGYWSDPEMTATVLAEGWLKTGDLAYQDEDGYFYLIGRSFDMIKSGAHRISPKDIEEVLLELDGIEEAAAIGIDDELLGQVIKAVVVSRPGGELDRRTVLAHCRKNLASYKIPKLVEFVDQIPKTSSGKIIRYKLQEQMLKQ
jgi:acyl-CoA synthetase (AMP-forming)/AMP-acid ligase II